MTPDSTRLRRFIADRRGGDPGALDEWSAPDVLELSWMVGRRLCRGALLRARLGSSGGLVFCDRHVRIHHARHVRAGRDLDLEEGCFINGLSRRGVVFGDRCTVGRGAVVAPSGLLGGEPGEGLLMGDHSNLGAWAYVGCSGFISIGSNVLMGPRVSLLAEDHNAALDRRADQGAGRHPPADHDRGRRLAGRRRHRGRRRDDRPRQHRRGRLRRDPRRRAVQRRRRRPRRARALPPLGRRGPALPTPRPAGRPHLPAARLPRPAMDRYLSKKLSLVRFLAVASVDRLPRLPLRAGGVRARAARRRLGGHVAQGYRLARAHALGPAGSWALVLSCYVTQEPPLSVLQDLLERAAPRVPRPADTGRRSASRDSITDGVN